MHNDFFAVLTAGGLLLCFLGSLFAVRIARAARALPDREIASLASRVESLTASHVEMRELCDRLADQVKMMNVRSKITHATRKGKTTDEPDANTDPDAWRQWMTKKLNRQRAGLTE